MHLLRHTLVGLRAMVVLTVVLGIAYPLLVTGIAQVAMPHQANGSVIEVGGHQTSTLLAQQFEGPQWLHPRPSKAGDHGYDGLASAGSNLGPNSAELRAEVLQRKEAIAQENHTESVPSEAVTASASGLDPHISPAYADLQVARIARARGIGEDRVRDAIRAGTQGPTLGFLGEARVNVVIVNSVLPRN